MDDIGRRNRVSRFRANFGTQDWQLLLPGARSKTFEQGGCKLRLLELTPEFTEREWCTAGHVGYVLAGEMEVNFGGRMVRFRAGDGLFIPAGCESRHKAAALTDVVRLTLVEAVPAQEPLGGDTIAVRQVQVVDTPTVSS